MRGQGMKQSRWKIVDQSWCRLIAIRANTIWSGSVESISSTKPELVDYRMACEGGDVCLTSRGSSRSEEHTSELQSLMRTSYAVFCSTKNTISSNTNCAT